MGQQASLTNNGISAIISKANNAFIVIRTKNEFFSVNPD